jgi:cyclophilin family peptidyl-prolyl cis-trans isomerase
MTGFRQARGAFVASVVAVGVAIAPAAASVDVAAGAAQNAQAPVMVIETQKGTIEITFAPADAPKSVEHILSLAKTNFYRGQRFHRVTASLAQFGDPGSRDMSRIDYWGSGGSGRPIGIAEFSKRLTHVRGTVALAHSGNPAAADSQLYIMKSASPGLNGKHTIVGRVTAGMAVVDRIVKTDRLVNVTIK